LLHCSAVVILVPSPGRIFLAFLRKDVYDLVDAKNFIEIFEASYNNKNCNNNNNITTTTTTRTAITTTTARTTKQQKLKNDNNNCKNKQNNTH
jgi:hypothetical protein